MIEKILKEINRLKKELDGYSALEALDYIKSYINTLPEEHNEDLEEAADKYAQQHSELLGFDCDCEPIQTGPELKKAVKFGAEWQKQQMMKDAVETTIVNDWQYGKDPDHAIIPAIHQRISGFNMGDKVKIIILKEEQQ